MSRSPRQRLLRLLSIAFAAAPFAFAVVRGLRTGSDLRFLRLALASFFGATLVMWLGRSRRRRGGALLALAAGAFVLAAVVAAATAWLLGARSAASVWFVSVGVALCWAVSYALDALAERPV